MVSEVWSFEKQWRFINGLHWSSHSKNLRWIHNLAEFSVYGDFYEELICNRIVVGLRDQKLSEKLQMDYELTLEKAVTCARQTEAIKQQQTTLKSQSETTNSIEIIKRTGFPNRITDHSTRQQLHGCIGHGKSPMLSKAQCPAKDASCKKCHKKGQFQGVCWSKVTNSAVVKIEHEEDAFIGPITSTGLTESWTATLSALKLIQGLMSLHYQTHCMTKFVMDPYRSQIEF